MYNYIHNCIGSICYLFVEKFLKIEKYKGKKSLKTPFFS